MICCDPDSRMDADLVNCINCEQLVSPPVMVLRPKLRETKKLTWQELRKSDTGKFAFIDTAWGG